MNSFGNLWCKTELWRKFVKCNIYGKGLGELGKKYPVGKRSAKKRTAQMGICGRAVVGKAI
jgi:hypothetical protein